MRTELAEARFAKMEALKQAGSAERSLHLATLTATRLEALKDHYEEQLNKTEAERDALKSRVEELQTDLAELQSDYDKHASDYQIEPDSNATLGLVPS
jgi:chromosome segregation ATPase